MLPSLGRTVSGSIERTPLTPYRIFTRPSTSLVVIALVAILVMTPELVVGLTVTDNFRFNLTWPEQFTELFRSGHLYPRWLPRSWDGFGSPVFYFYPPLFFWVASLVDTLTGGDLGPERLVPLASLVLLVISGAAMRAWLRAHCSETRAVGGALAYIVAPYHLYDLYGRGALAEASAYAAVPLVMLALIRTDHERRSLVPLALAFALLLFSHLPTALLVSLFLIAPYTVFIAFRSRRPLQFLLRASAAGLLSIMLSAIFVLPALALLPSVSPMALSGSFYRPENWFFWNLNAGAMGGRMLLIVPISIAALLFAVAAALNCRTRPSHPECLFWSALTIFLVILVAGFLPFMWRLPGLALVQFPWRALLLVEFTTITLLATATFPSRNLILAGAGAILGFAYLVLTMIGGHMVGRTWSEGQRTASEIRSHYRDAPEYLPAGTPIHQGNGPDSTQIALPNVPLASASVERAATRAVEAKDGEMTIFVDSAATTSILVHRFYFPHWKVRDAAGREVPVVAEPATHAVRFQAPRGHSIFRLKNGAAPYELLARMLSLAALLVLGLIAGAASLRRVTASIP